METVLSFFVNLMIVVGGTFTLILVIALFVVLAIEIWDAFHEEGPDDFDEDLSDPRYYR